MAKQITFWIQGGDLIKHKDCVLFPDAYSNRVDSNNIFIQLGRPDTGIELNKIKEALGDNKALIDKAESITFVILAHGNKNNSAKVPEYTISLSTNPPKFTTPDELFNVFNEAIPDKPLNIITGSCFGGYYHDSFNILSRNSILLTLSDKITPTTNTKKSKNFFEGDPQMPNFIEIAREWIKDNISVVLQKGSISYYRADNGVIEHTTYAEIAEKYILSNQGPRLKAMVSTIIEGIALPEQKVIELCEKFQKNPNLFQQCSSNWIQDVMPNLYEILFSRSDSDDFDFDALTIQTSEEIEAEKLKDDLQKKNLYTAYIKEKIEEYGVDDFNKLLNIYYINPIIYSHETPLDFGIFTKFTHKCTIDGTAINKILPLTIIGQNESFSMLNFLNCVGINVINCSGINPLVSKYPFTKLFALDLLLAGGVQPMDPDTL